MSEILSREEFDRCNPLPEGRPTVVWQSHLEAQAATIEALAAALKHQTKMRDADNCADYLQSPEFEFNYAGFLDARKAGWLA